jgi:hypothetical protein
VSIDIGTAVGQPGSTHGFAVTFVSDNGFDVVGVSHCIEVNEDTPFAATGTGAPDCTVNAAIQKPNSTFTFVPANCNPVSACDAMCADISGPQGSPTIPDDTQLYSCRIAIPGSTENGSYPLLCAGPSSATTSDGGTLGVDCVDGEVIVQTNLPGDCNGDGRVTIEELILGVNIALGIQPVTACPAFDTDDSGSVTIDELIAAVNVALNGP